MVLSLLYNLKVKNGIMSISLVNRLQYNKDIAVMQVIKKENVVNVAKQLAVTMA